MKGFLGIFMLGYFFQLHRKVCGDACIPVTDSLAKRVGCRCQDALRQCFAGEAAQDMLRIVQATGSGYGMSKQQELETMQRLAHSTGEQPYH